MNRPLSTLRPPPVVGRQASSTGPPPPPPPVPRPLPATRLHFLEPLAEVPRPIGRAQQRDALWIVLVRPRAEQQRLLNRNEDWEAQVRGGGDAAAQAPRRLPHALDAARLVELPAPARALRARGAVPPPGQAPAVLPAEPVLVGGAVAALRVEF